MGGFRKAMPFTFGCMVIGGLALAAVPPFSGFFSKDEILAYTINRGGGYVVLGVVGYVAALMTAFYAFRMVFRVFFGKQVPEARELEEGHMSHGAHRNPATGEEEDTEVGFPGSEHHIAERARPMRLAMVGLALLAIVAGALGVPTVTETLERFLEPTFEESAFRDVHPSEGAELTGLLIGGLVAITGLAAAFLVYLHKPGTAASARMRLSRLHGFLANKWYFDELFDYAIVRPMAAAGRFGQVIVENEVVQATIVGGTVGIVRAGTSFARSLQTGEVRGYAALLLAGLAALVLYFLMVAS